MAAAIKRWANAKLAQRHNVDPAVAKKIANAVASAKKQELQGGETADLIERAIGRKLHEGEFTILSEAKKHHEHDPPGGYSGPKAKDAPDRKAVDEKKRDQALAIQARGVAKLNQAIDASRKARNSYGAISTRWTPDDARREKSTIANLFNESADEFDVAADAFEEAGPSFAVRAGTLHKRADLIRKAASDPVWPLNTVINISAVMSFESYGAF